MKRIILLSFTLTMGFLSYGQGENDALRNTRNDLSGSARGLGMGGAFGALGGDLTGVMANPAGIGVYRSSEVVTTLNFSSANIETNWQGTTNSDSRFKFNFDNIAYMGYFPLGNETTSSINFGFTYSRLKNFDRQYTSSGRGMTTSLTDYMAELANSEGYGPQVLGLREGYDPYRSNASWLTVLGYNGDLIAYDDGKKMYSPRTLSQGATVDPFLKVSEKGYIETYDFTLGTNFSEKLYLGATFSLTDMYYSMSSQYSEEFNNGTNLDGYDLYNDMIEDGAGYQVSIGAIFRPVDALRIGLAYHSPTWYNLTRSYVGETNYEYMDGGESVYTESWTPKDAYLDYQLKTPYRWTASIAGIIGTKAIVSLDYEITDYTGMDMQEPDGYNYVDNEYIDEDFKTTSSIKAGIEYRVTPQFSARAGYAWMQNPYKKEFKDGLVAVPVVGTIPHYTVEGDANYITCGIGYRITNNFYVDAAFVYRTQTDELFYYPKFFEAGSVVLNSTPAKFTNSMYKGVLTLGYKF